MNDQPQQNQVNLNSPKSPGMISNSGGSRIQTGVDEILLGAGQKKSSINSSTQQLEFQKQQSTIDQDRNQRRSQTDDDTDTQAFSETAPDKPVKQSNTNNIPSNNNQNDPQYTNGTEEGQFVLRRIQENKDLLQNNTELEFFLDYFQNYRSFNNEVINIEDLNASKDLQIQKYQNCIYYGEYHNNQRCGKGIMIYSDGRLYEGYWQNDFQFGRGFQIYPSGNRYDGYYVNGKAEGMGTYFWFNGEVYDGQWVGGMKHGSGMWKGVQNDSYIGEWKMGKPDGYGVHTWVNGDRYEGQFQQCLKHGTGSEQFQNGDSYNGDYINGRPQGYGEYKWSNGSSYKGEFKNGLRHGKGVWVRSIATNADKYQGDYQNDQKNGKGVFQWSSGNEYRGSYFDDLRQGYGEMYWTDSSYYKGNWDQGVQCGYGQLFMPQLGVQKGYFFDNVYQGEKPMAMPDGTLMSKPLQTDNNDHQVNKDLSASKVLKNKSLSPKGEQSKSLKNSLQVRSYSKKKLNKNNSGISDNNYEGSTLPVGSGLYRTPKNTIKYNGGDDEDEDGYQQQRSSMLPDIRRLNHSLDVNSSGKQNSQPKMYLNNTMDDSQLDEIDLNQRSISVHGHRQSSTQTNTPLQRFRKSLNNFESLHSGGKSEQFTLPLIKVLDKRSRKKQYGDQILLKKHELILWKNYQQRHVIPQGDFQDLTDPYVCKKIRDLIHPPVWQPTGIASMARSPTSRDNSPNLKYGGGLLIGLPNERVRMKSLV